VSAASDQGLDRPDARPRRRGPLFLQPKRPKRRCSSASSGHPPTRTTPPRGGRSAAHAGEQRHLLGLGARRRIDGQERDFYFRQLRDWKGSADLDNMIPSGMTMYGTLCGWTLARAHARSGDRVQIAATSARATCSTRRSPTSRSPTPSRTPATTPLCRRRRRRPGRGRDRRLSAGFPIPEADAADVWEDARMAEDHEVHFSTRLPETVLAPYEPTCSHASPSRAACTR